MTTFKKCLSLILLLSCIFAFTCSSCSKEEKAETAYFDWFGVRLDLGDSDIILDITNTATGLVMKNPTFEEIICEYESEGTSYAVLRVKCVGDIRKRVYESAEHFAFHYASFDFEQRLIKTYTDFPAEVLEVLEGDTSVASIGNVIDIDLLGFSIEHNYIYSMILGQELEDIYRTEPKEKVGLYLCMPEGIKCTIPRIGYEYVVLVRYSPELNVYTVSMDNSACELSSPKDQIKFKQKFRVSNKIHDIYNSTKLTDEEKMPDVYWEILERYNIKIK